MFLRREMGCYVQKQVEKKEKKKEKDEGARGKGGQSKAQKGGTGIQLPSLSVLSS